MRRAVPFLVFVAVVGLILAVHGVASAQAVVSYIPEPSTPDSALPVAPVVQRTSAFTSYRLPPAPLEDGTTSVEPRAPLTIPPARFVTETATVEDVVKETPSGALDMPTRHGQACACPTCCVPELPIRLPQPCILQSMGIKTSGWVQAGFTANGYSPSDRWNGPVFLNDRSNDFLLNQLWLAFEKPVDTQGCGTDIGGRFDIMYGSDWRYGAAWGLEKRINSPDSLHGLIIPQLYGEVGINRLKLKAGHFATLYGKEWVPSPANFFYSHTLSMAWEPLLVTGMTADYALTDNVTVNIGANNGWNMFEDYNGEWSLTTGVNWKINPCTSIRYNMMNGKWDPQGLYNRSGHYLVLDRKITDRLSYAGQYTFIHEQNGSFSNPGEDAQIHGLAQWLFYTLSEKWSLGARFEWFSNPQGRGVSGIANWLEYDEPDYAGRGAGWGAAPGFEGEFYNLSLGANYRPYKNMVVRPEVRWDWYDGTRNVQNLLPYNEGTRSRQTLFAVDFVFMF